MRPNLRICLAPLARSQSRAFTSMLRPLREEHHGRGPEEHVTNLNHRHDIQADASNRGQQARAEDQNDGLGSDSTQKNSTATSQTSTSTARDEEAKTGRKDRGMGLQDERGGKGH